MSVKGKRKKGNNKGPIKRKRPKMNVRQYVLIGILLLATIAFIFSSIPRGPMGPPVRSNTSTSTTGTASTNTSSTSSVTSEPQFKEEGSLSFINGTDQSEIRQIKIELADTEAEQAQGMMYRKSIPNDTGMLFVFDQPKMQSFYMRNTYVSLDIIFINEQLEIVNIAKKAVPLTETNLRSTEVAKYVLEVAAGYTDAYNIKAGDKINFTLN